jgi:hypothetical protein
MSNQLTKRPCPEEPEQPARHLPADVVANIISYACHPLGRREHQAVWQGFRVFRHQELTIFTDREEMLLTTYWHLHFRGVNVHGVRVIENKWNESLVVLHI